MKTTLREIIEKYNLDVRLTPNQNIILCGIRKAWKRPITTALAQAGLLVSFFLFFLLLVSTLSSVWLFHNFDFFPRIKSVD